MLVTNADYADDTCWRSALVSLADDICSWEKKHCNHLSVAQNEVGDSPSLVKPLEGYTF